MTALWTSSNGFGGGWGGSNGNGWGNGDGWSNGNGNGNGYSHGDGSGNGNGYSHGDGNGNGCSHGYGDGDGNGDGGPGYGHPEQAHDGCIAIGRLLVYEATLPVADLLTLAVTR